MPGIVLADTFHSAAPKRFPFGLAHDNRLLKLCREFRRLKRNAGVTGYFGVFRRVAIQHQCAAPHRFDQRGVSSADLCGMDVGKTVRAELLVSLTINLAGHNDAVITSVTDTANVLG